MEKKTTGIIVTIVAVLLCGCPGLLALCGGLFTVIDIFGGLGVTGYGEGDIVTPVIGICGGLVFIIIAALVAFFMLRKKPEEAGISNEPLPPAY